MKSKITKKSVIVYYSGTSDYYGGAFVQGAFSGYELYHIADAERALKKKLNPGQELTDRDMELTVHNCRPYRTCGYRVQ